jgi:hypothetical protein
VSAGEPLNPRKRSEFTTKMTDWAKRLMPDRRKLDSGTKARKRFGLWA